METTQPVIFWEVLNISTSATQRLKSEDKIGRGKNCQLHIEDDNLSREHAQFEIIDNVLFLNDLNSTNGTFVNDVRITNKVELRDGDRIRLHNQVFSVLYNGPDNTQKQTSDQDQAPQTWAVERSKSVNNTQIMSDTMMGALKRIKQAKEAAKSVDHPTLMGKTEPVNDKPFSLVISEKQEWEIGRSESADICIDDASVSTEHAQLLHKDGKWKIVDSMSGNGTYVNQEKTLSSYLSNGDIIRLGTIECQFLIPQSEHQTQTKKNKASGSNQRRLMLTSIVLTGLGVAVAAWFFLAA